MDSTTPYYGSEPLKAFLHAFLSTHTELDVMRHFVGTPLFAAPAYLNLCAVVCVNFEWWQKAPHPTTEIGIAEMPALGLYPSVHAENILSTIRVAHARILETAHLLNNFDGVGNPEEFNFGTTKFVTVEEAKEVLINTFQRERVDGSSFTQPIIFVGHNAESKFAHIKEKFGIDLLALGTIVKVIDTQKLAAQTGIRGPKGATISLRHLVEHFNIVEKNLHTAGNDAGYTMITAVLASVKNDLYGNLPLVQAFGKPPANVRGRHIQDVVTNVMMINQHQAPPPWGWKLYCTRCGRFNHRRMKCFAKVFCVICKASQDPKVQGVYQTHMTEKCITLAHEMASAEDFSSDK